VASRFGLRRGWFGRWPPLLVGPGYGALLSLTLLLAPASGKAFIYFQF
jgi:hypothetical protein